MKNNDHGPIHAAKVCLFAALLGERLDLNEEDILSLMSAAIFHDIGRINNSDNTTHGDESIRRLREYGFEVSEVVETIIRLHSRGDRKLKNNFLVKVFKDADALDRVRTGDLNTKFIRFSETKDYINLAMEVNTCLSKLTG